MMVNVTIPVPLILWKIVTYWPEEWPHWVLLGLKQIMLQFHPSLRMFPNPNPEKPKANNKKLRTLNPETTRNTSLFKQNKKLPWFCIKPSMKGPNKCSTKPRQNYTPLRPQMMQACGSWRKNTWQHLLYSFLWGHATRLSIGFPLLFIAPLEYVIFSGHKILVSLLHEFHHFRIPNWLYLQNIQIHVQTSQHHLLRGKLKINLFQLICATRTPLTTCLQRRCDTVMPTSPW